MYHTHASQRARSISIKKITPLLHPRTARACEIPYILYIPPIHRTSDYNILRARRRIGSAHTCQGLFFGRRSNSADAAANFLVRAIGGGLFPLRGDPRPHESNKERTNFRTWKFMSLRESGIEFVFWGFMRVRVCIYLCVCAWGG